MNDIYKIKEQNDPRDGNGAAGYHAKAAALIQAGGGVVERMGPSGPLVALVFRRRYGDEWSLPKGKQEPGETLAETALREVTEETGFPVCLVDFAGCSHYHDGNTPKVVLYWRMRPAGDARFKASEEVEALEWLPPAAALVRLKYPEEKRILAALYDTASLPEGELL